MNCRKIRRLSAISGTLSGNTATGNSDDGFYVFNFNGGTLSGNTANNNGYGFFVGDFNGGNTATFSLNEATDNAFQGYGSVVGSPQTGAGTNTGSGNGSDDSF